jgi:hypothetical protein
LKYSEVKRRIRVIRAFGYGKIVGADLYYKEWRQESGDKVFKVKHHLSIFDVKYYTPEVLSSRIMMIEDNALQQIRRAVITDGYTEV